MTKLWLMGLGRTLRSNQGTPTRRKPCWIRESGLCYAAEPSRLSRNGVSGAAGKPLAMKQLQGPGGGGGEGGGLTGTLSGVSFLGWDSGERGEEAQRWEQSRKLRRGKAVVGVFTVSACLFKKGGEKEGKSVREQGKVEYSGGKKLAWTERGNMTPSAATTVGGKFDKSNEQSSCRPRVTSQWSLSCGCGNVKYRVWVWPCWNQAARAEVGLSLSPVDVFCSRCLCVCVCVRETHWVWWTSNCATGRQAGFRAPSARQ